MNSRTANLPDYQPDYINGNDGAMPLNMLTNEISNCRKLEILQKYDCLNRISEDKSSNKYGSELLKLCKSTNLIILNGRCGLDKGIGKFTESNTRGSSVVDYVLCSHGIF